MNNQTLLWQHNCHCSHWDLRSLPAMKVSLVKFKNMFTVPFILMIFLCLNSKSVNKSNQFTAHLSCWMSSAINRLHATALAAQLGQASHVIARGAAHFLLFACARIVIGFKQLVCKILMRKCYVGLAMGCGGSWEESPNERLTAQTCFAFPFFRQQHVGSTQT